MSKGIFDVPKVVIYFILAICLLNNKAFACKFDATAAVQLPCVSFVSASTTVDEGVGNITIELQVLMPVPTPPVSPGMPVPPPIPIVDPYTILANFSVETLPANSVPRFPEHIATEGLDFTFIGGQTTLTQAQHSIQVSITNDILGNEPLESFRLLLQPSPDYQIGSLAAFAITIMDNDVVWVGALSSQGTKSIFQLHIGDNGTGVVEGVLMSAGYSSLPESFTGWTGILERNPTNFNFSVSGVPFPAKTNTIRSMFTREFVLTAAPLQTPGDVISDNLIRGKFVERYVPSNVNVDRHWERIIEGQFTLTKSMQSGS